MAAKNPILTEPEIVQRFEALPRESQEALYDYADFIYRYARPMADRCWAQSKDPMALYWKRTAAWAFHLRRALYRYLNRP